MGKRRRLLIAPGSEFGYNGGEVLVGGVDPGEQLECLGLLFGPPLRIAPDVVVGGTQEAACSDTVEGALGD